MNNDVASQSNLLALNAAIEAARAGEQAAAGVEEATAQIDENTAKATGLNRQVGTLERIARLVLKSDERTEPYRQDAAAQEEAEQQKKAA